MLPFPKMQWWPTASVLGRKFGGGQEAAAGAGAGAGAWGLLCDLFIEGVKRARVHAHLQIMQ